MSVLAISLLMYINQSLGKGLKPVSQVASETASVKSELPEKENYIERKVIVEEDGPHEPITLSFAGDVYLTQQLEMFI